MTAPRQSAHPILEPLDHELTPERAAMILAGDNLAVYSLLWKAAIATAMDGPALRVERLTLNISGDVFRVSMQAAQVVSEEPGWGELLPSELRAAESRIDEFAAPFPSLLTETLKKTGSARLDAGGYRRRDGHQCAPAAALLGDTGSWQVDAVLLHNPALSVDRLVESMEQHGIGRPSTFADRLNAALENDLLQQVDDRILLGNYGQTVLQKLQTQAATAQVGAVFSADLEQALAKIEAEPKYAGEVLKTFIARAVGGEGTLSDWLDDLHIEGESMTEAVARSQTELPATRDWTVFCLPPGLSPQNLIHDRARACYLRDELDALLAAADRSTWKKAAPRRRAAARLAALEGRSIFHRSERLLAQGARDIALRWWIDLSPDECVLSAAELAQARTVLVALDESHMQAIISISEELGIIL